MNVRADILPICEIEDLAVPRAAAASRRGRQEEAAAGGRNLATLNIFRYR